MSDTAARDSQKKNSKAAVSDSRKQSGSADSTAGGAMRDSWEMTIGIECHVQLDTRTKLFSRAENDAEEADPNSKVSQLCFGLPGTLPVLNKRAVELAVTAGFGLNAEIAEFSKFDRKHYFYPDLPKGYQISQFDQPTVGEGHLDIVADGEPHRVGIERAHIEEDAGKLTHVSSGTLVDLNRAGTPLIEIVSRPDIHSAAQAKAYCRELYLIMKMLRVSRANLYYGNMRFDVNLSIAKKGAKELGTRTETKNLNSFRNVERAVQYEFKRQVKVLEGGGEIVQETRGWDDAKQQTYSMRSKEDAADYRYFPDPDLPAIRLSPERVNEIKSAIATLPGGELWLPGVWREQLSDLGVDGKGVEAMLERGADQPKYLDLMAELLGIDHEIAGFALKYCVNELFAMEGDVHIPEAKQFVDVYKMSQSGDLSSTNAKKLLAALKDGESAAEMAESRGLVQMNDSGELETIVDQVMADNPKAVEDLRGGNDRTIGFLVGAVMKASKGQANPAQAKDLILSKIK